VLKRWNVETLKGGKMNAKRLRPIAFAVLMLVAVTVAAVAVPRSAGADDNRWLGEYYANPYLMGPPALIREDATINFDWSGASPAPQIPQVNFSVRWTRTLTFDAGRYRFTTQTDDGVRLFLDGGLIIDQWRDQPPTVYNAERDLAAGQHSLRMEYYQASGGAVARLSWVRVDGPPPQGAWRGEYFANPSLSGWPALVRDDPNINFDWSGGSPAPQIPQDNFSVRWTRTVPLETGRYRFTTQTDDGVRLYLDGQLIVDQWRDQPPTSYSAERDLGAGQHSLRMEYYQASGGAVARLTWTRVGPPPPPPPPPPQGPWRGEYFANPSLSGSPALVRDDPAINFVWSGGSPAPQIPQDNFSVRWTRTITFDAGRYRFTTETDDGVRLYLDGQLIIDKWRDQPPTATSAERDLAAGQHSLRMEYYQASGGAVARLAWTRVGPPPPPKGSWRGEYFANPSLYGPPALVRNDADINFNWGLGSPAPQIPPDNFSVRWTRTARFEGGRYRFRTTTDDGVRLYVDGRLVINRWYDMAATTFDVYLDLGAGNHTVRMDYYEHLGNAVAKLSWEKQKEDKPGQVGNIITCARPGNSWVRVYRLDGSVWADTNSKGYGPIGGSGRLKLDGFLVDTNRYGAAGHPYRVEVWTNGVRVRSVGNTAAGEASFRVRAWADNYTPWGCP
jgi:hypothetical protein